MYVCVCMSSVSFLKFFYEAYDFSLKFCLLDNSHLIDISIEAVVLERRYWLGIGISYCS